MRHAALALIATVLLLPPLVHATTHLGDGHDTAASFRLKRAFDVPQSKWTVTPPEREPFDHDVAEASAPLLRWQRAADIALMPGHQHHRSPDPLRGPPLK
jgi:hypothetical protein